MKLRPLNIIGSICSWLFYSAFLGITMVFVFLIFIGEQFLPPRSDHHAHRYTGWLPGRAGMMAMDIASVVVAYLLADYIRCVAYMQTTWPEHVQGVGSTLHLHLEMLAVIIVVWPTILHLMGWYKPARRSNAWRLRRSMSSMAVLGLIMSATSLLIHRLLFPRAQIVFAVAALPIATAAVRSIVLLVGRVFHLSSLRARTVDWG